MDEEESGRSGSEADDGRPSFLEPLGWRRRTVRIAIAASGPTELEASITSVRFAPHPALRRTVDAVPGSWLEGMLRRTVGRAVELRIVFRQGTLRAPSALLVGGDEIMAGEVEAVGLQSWQERAGRPPVWDVWLLGPDRDLVVGHRSREQAQDLASKVAAVLGVPVREPEASGSKYRYTRLRDLRRNAQPVRSPMRYP